MTRSGKPSGMPNGRPAKEIDDTKDVNLHMHIPPDVARKLDALRTGNETRKDILVRIVREYEAKGESECQRKLNLSL